MSTVNQTRTEYVHVSVGATMTTPDPLRAALHDNPEWPCSCSGLYDENRHTAAVRAALAATAAPTNPTEVSSRSVPDPLRAALDKAIAAIDDPTRYIEVSRHYRAGWVDALMAFRDDPALAPDTAPLDDRPSMPCCANTYGLPVPCQHPPLTYSEADRQAAYKAGWDDARAVIAEPLDVGRLADAYAEGWFRSPYDKAHQWCDEDSHGGHSFDRVAWLSDLAVRLAKERDQG